MKLNHLVITKNFSKPGYLNSIIVPEYLNVDTKEMIEERQRKAGVKLADLLDDEKIEVEFEHFMRDLPAKMRLNKVKNVMEMNPADLFLIPRDNEVRAAKFSKMKTILRDRAIEFQNKTGYDIQGATDLLDKAKYGILTKTALNDNAFNKVKGWYHDKIQSDPTIRDSKLKSDVDKLLSEITDLETECRKYYYEGNYEKSDSIKRKIEKKIEMYNGILRSAFIKDQMRSKTNAITNIARETTDDQVIDCVIKTLDRGKKADVIIGYLASPLGKVDKDLRKQLNINDRTTNLIGVKLADPFSDDKGKFIRADEEGVARRAIAGMNDKKLNNILLHIHEESSKDPTLVNRCKLLAKQAGNALYNAYDYADTALKIYSYFVDVRPNSPVRYLSDFLSGVGKLMSAKKKIEKAIENGRNITFSSDQGIETKKDDETKANHYDDEKFDGDVEKEGVIQKKKNGAWGVVSKKTGYFWKQNYDSKEDAEKALKAYHAQHNFDFSFPNNIKLRIMK